MQNTSNTSASLDASALFGMQTQPPEPETIPEYPVSYEESDKQDSGFTEFDFYQASRAWKRNKISIGNGYFVYKSNFASYLPLVGIPPNTSDASASSNASASSKANQIMWYAESDSD